MIQIGYHVCTTIRSTIGFYIFLFDSWLVSKINLNCFPLPGFHTCWLNSMLFSPTPAIVYCVILLSFAPTILVYNVSFELISYTCDDGSQTTIVACVIIVGYDDRLAMIAV